MIHLRLYHKVMTVALVFYSTGRVEKERKNVTFGLISHFSVSPRLFIIIINHLIMDMSKT